MRWLIRRVLKKGKGAVSYEEDVHYGDALTIGRAADQAIFLPDLRAALNHARITLLSSGEYKIEIADHRRHSRQRRDHLRDDRCGRRDRGDRQHAIVAPARLRRISMAAWK